MIQLLQSGLWAVLVTLMIIDGARLDTLDPDLAARFDTVEEARTGMIVGAVFGLAVVAAMVTLGIITLRYVNGCRVASAIMQIILGSFMLLSVVGDLVDGPDARLIADVVTVITCVVAAVCLYHPSARDACLARRPTAWRPPPPAQYPGGYPPYAAGPPPSAAGYPPYAGGPPPYAGGPGGGSSPWAPPPA